MKRFKALALAGLLLGAATPALAMPADAIEGEVRSFVQPTQARRLESLKALLDAHGLPYEVQTFAGGKPGAPLDGHNVVVTLGEGDKDILLSAHYDAIVLKDGTLVDGVVDNAASVVALVHAADALKGVKLKHRLRILFTDQEELGLLGAKAYAAGSDVARVAAVINFDINAYGDTPFFADAGPTQPEAALSAATLAGCEAAGEDCQAFVQYPPSDHLAFRKIGVPAISFSYLPKDEVGKLRTMMQAAGKASAPSREDVPRVLSVIHTPADTMAEVQPGTISRAARLAVEVVRAFDAR